MKVIDLLNKIANNEEVPKEIKLNGRLCSFDNEDKDYYCEEYGNIVWYLVDTSNNMNEVLYTDLEIIEEKPKKIEKIDICPLDTTYQGVSSLDRATRSNVNKLFEKVDELTKAVNYLLEKESEE